MRTDTINFRDPFIWVDRIEGRYWMVGTLGATCWNSRPDALEAYWSLDLREWQGPVRLFAPGPDFWSQQEYWAPEMHHIGDCWYLAVTFKSPDRRRGTQLLRADRPDGPYQPISEGPLTPTDWECLDGTLFQDDAGRCWMVFCHEWVQIGDGAICAMPLDHTLSAPAGDPVRLFTASQSGWADPLPGHPKCWVTDGPFLWRLSDGRLAMLWSSFVSGRYAQGVAISENRVLGPWRHMPSALADDDAGHGMLFRALDGALYLALHQPNRTPDERPVFRMVVECPEGLRLT